MRIVLRFSPKGVTLWFTAFLHQLAKAGCLHLHQLHETKKSARELRQGESDYRCCIPALAGFVSPQSIVPDGNEISSRCCETQMSVVQLAARCNQPKGKFRLIRRKSVRST